MATGVAGSDGSDTDNGKGNQVQPNLVPCCPALPCFLAHCTSSHAKSAERYLNENNHLFSFLHEHSELPAPLEASPHCGTALCRYPKVYGCINCSRDSNADGTIQPAGLQLGAHCKDSGLPVRVLCSA